MPNLPKSKRRPWKPEPAPAQSGRKVVHGFYHSPAWRKFRKLYMLSNPLCVQCKHEGKLIQGSVLDHIKPINRIDPYNTHHGEFGEPLKETNVQTLCTHHHAVKSGKERHQ